MADEPTRDDLIEEAGKLDIKGRHQMSKADLEEAIKNARAASDEGDSTDGDEAGDESSEGEPDATDQDEGSEVPAEAREALEDQSDRAAEEEQVAGETGTDVGGNDPTNEPPPAAPETTMGTDPARDSDSNDESGEPDEDSGESTGRGVGFRR